MKRANSSEYNSIIKDGNKLTFYDLLADVHVRKAFAKFNTSQTSSSSFMAVSIVITFSALALIIRFLFYLRTDPSRENVFAAAACTVLAVFLVLVLWIVNYLKFGKPESSKNYFVRTLYYMRPALHVILPVGMSVFFGIYLNLRVRGGDCGDKLYMEKLMCNPNHGTHGMPEETVVQLILLPIVFHVTLRDSIVGTFLLSWSISIVSIFVASTSSNMKQTTPFLVAYFFYSLIILYDNQRQNLFQFELSESLKFALEENERQADETHASELRHMIANVAHDLKTPLASFLSGIEFISQIVTDWDERICDPERVSEVLGNFAFTSESLTAIYGMLDSIRNTNSFMIMTINRCIDFTKASKGFKLIPKLETIDLQETVDLPVKVMRDFKSDLAITMLAIPSNICTHIISDRQWLQENLLCLMSNAVKYSSKGTVEIAVSLVTMPVPNRSNANNSHTTKPDTKNRKDANKAEQRASKLKIDPSLPSLSPGRSKAGGASLSPNNHNNKNNMIFPSNSMRSINSMEESEVSMRKLSNFVFNHAYSTVGRSNKVYCESNATEGSGDQNQCAAPVSGNGIGDEVVSFNELEEGNAGTDEPILTKPSTHQTAQFLRIDVEDTGIGLSAEAMEGLFSPFKQAQRLAGGTGLGLYSLAKRIEALNGHYGVSNRRDKKRGSLFWFAIPYRPDTAFAQVALQKQTGRLSRGNSSSRGSHGLGLRTVNTRSASDDLIDLEQQPCVPLGCRSTSNNSIRTDGGGGFGGGITVSNRPVSGHSDSANSTGDSAQPSSGIASLSPRLSILVVDDSLSILKVTSMVLKRRGHTVAQADNGAVALDLILQGYEKCRTSGGYCTPEGTPYDVVLMDLQMPVMDGLEAVRRLRQSEKTILTKIYQSQDSLPVGDASGGDRSTGAIRSIIGSFFFGHKNSLKKLEEEEEFNALPPDSGDGRRRSSSLPSRHQLVIGVSANSDNETMTDAIYAGFDAFIGKPFSIDAFYEVLEELQQKLNTKKETKS